MAILRADMERGADQGKPAHLGTLQGETPLVMQSAKPLEVQCQQLLSTGVDK